LPSAVRATGDSAYFKGWDHKWIHSCKKSCLTAGKQKSAFMLRKDTLACKFSGHCGRPGFEAAAFYIFYLHSVDEAQRKAVPLELLIPEKMLAVWPENREKRG